MTTAVTLASQHNEIVSNDSYEKAVNDIKEAINADFCALCRKLHVKAVFDEKYYENWIENLIKTQSEVAFAFNNEIQNVNKEVELGNEFGDNQHSVRVPLNVNKEFFEAKKDKLAHLEDLQKRVETVLEALRKFDSKIAAQVSALPTTENQFLEYIKDIVMKTKNDLSHDIFEYINKIIPDIITSKLLEENNESKLIETDSTMLYDFNESLDDIVNCLVSKHINEKSNVLITSIISEFCAKCCTFITQYIVNSHSNDFIALSNDLKETVEDVMKSFEFGLKSWLDSCVDVSLIHEFNTLQQVKTTVKSIMQIFNKKVSLQANLAYYMEEPLEMIKIECYFDTIADSNKISGSITDESTVQPIIQAIDYEVNGPTIESFVNQLELNKFYPTSELLAKYVDYFGESITARAFADKVAGYLENKRKQINKVQTRGYIRVNKI